MESSRSFDSWVYAPIHADFAPHLIDPVFGKLHDFQFTEDTRKILAQEGIESLELTVVDAAAILVADGPEAYRLGEAPHCRRRRLHRGDALQGNKPEKQPAHCS